VEPGGSKEEDEIELPELHPFEGTAEGKDEPGRAEEDEEDGLASSDEDSIF
jgi:hypothetical protein